MNFTHIDTKISEEVSLLLGSGSSVQTCIDNNNAPLTCAYTSSNRSVTISFGSPQQVKQFFFTIGPFRNPDFSATVSNFSITV